MTIFLRMYKIMCRHTRNKFYVDRSIKVFTSFSQSYSYFKHVENKQLCIQSGLLRKFMHSGNAHDPLTDELEEYEREPEQIEEREHARNILFENSHDPVILDLNKCASIEEVLNCFQKNSSKYKDKHLTQTVLVLYDLQTMFYHFTNNTTSKEFIDKLYENGSFIYLLEEIKRSVAEFDPELLSYTFLYLNKLGLPAEDDLMQLIALKIRDILLEQCYLDIAARFLKVIFTERSIRPYYLSINLIPKILDQIDSCNSVIDFENLTICLNKLHNIITEKLLQKYKLKVKEFLQKQKLIGKDYSVILKIILFLNYPEWRNQNVPLSSECILLLKDQINQLNISELSLLYEVFYKNQEPGDVLNNIQWCSAKYLQQLEEALPSQIETKLKLFSSLIYFSSPMHRIQFRKDIEKYAKDCTNVNSLILLRKIFSYIKVSDEKLCRTYWDKSLELLKENESFENVEKLSKNYMNFNIDINNYRHYRFEHKIMKFTENNVNEISLFPSQLFTLLNFSIVYGKNVCLLDNLINKLEETYKQLKAIDCLKISQSLHLLNYEKNKFITKYQLGRIKKVLDKAAKNLLETHDNFESNNLLLKAAIIRNGLEDSATDELLMKYKEINVMSSKVIENTCFVFMSTRTLIPEVINQCTEYIIKNKNYVLGFNAEKILLLCYFLGYYPINADKFFQTVTDIIIRDQERLSGLAFLNSVLSLCFFNKLPKSFIKLVFNVEFLEKLDVELAHCYSKDRYPQRIRNSMMQLNRAVCLEHPECNVPWFHQKYVEEIQKKALQDKSEDHFSLRVREYLIPILGEKDKILENIVTPYGYNVDFVVNLNNVNQIVVPNEDESNTKLAILLMRDQAFTRFYIHLKGKYQLKKRHLEMLGYKVSIIKFSEWINLLYAGERIEYLKKVIWPDYE